VNSKGIIKRNGHGNVTGSFVSVYAMKAYEEVELLLLSFSITACDAGERPSSRPGRFTPGIHGIGS
jgi:hypothetical protein